MSKTALIIGASRGIGFGLAQRFREQGWQVIATYRNALGLQALQTLDGVRAEQVDILDRASVAALTSRLQGVSVEVLLVNAGISGPAHRDVEAASQEEIGALFMSNAIAPLQVAERLLANLKPDGVLAFTSSIMGSQQLAVAQHRLYSASKAALNHLAHSLAQKLGADSQRTLLCLHPGWVQTDMGGAAAPLDLLTSTAGLCRVLREAAGTGGLHFKDYQGQTLPW